MGVTRPRVVVTHWVHPEVADYLAAFSDALIPSRPEGLWPPENVAARKIPGGDARVRDGGFAGWRPQLYGSGLSGATVGIIGMGQLGQAIARRLAGFETQIVYHDARSLDAAAERGAFVVNVGRGSVVDEEAIAAALEAGRLGGYAADVFAMEDWLLPGHPAAIPDRLLRHPRTLFTPHLGSAVDDVRRRMSLQAARQIRQALEGGRPDHAVNQPAP